MGFGGQFGYYTDTETGLLCLTHRYYDPGTGKFINRDPIGYQGGINLYGFVGNNPVNYSDPSGFDPKKQADGDQCGLPDDNDGHWNGTTGNPGMHHGTPESKRANAMTRSLLDTLSSAFLAVINPEGKLVEGTVDAIQEWRIARGLARNKLQLAKRAAWEAKAAASAAPALKPAQIIAQRAATLGFPRRSAPMPWSNGQDVFFNGTKYISKDWDEHNATGGWKMFTKSGGRLGTFDANLNWIKP